MTIYVVTAYRWGQRDNHSYVVSAETSLERAKTVAQYEFEYRGGKYGIEICEAYTEMPVNFPRECPKQVWFIESGGFGQAGKGEDPANRTGTIDDYLERCKRLEKGAKQQ